MEQFLRNLKYCPLGIPFLRGKGWLLSQFKRVFVDVGLQYTDVLSSPFDAFWMSTFKKKLNKPVDFICELESEGVGVQFINE